MAVVQALLKAGASPAAKTTNTGVTALHLAAASGNAEVVKLLLERGADANARESEWGQTPLMFAAALNRADAITALLARRRRSDRHDQDDRRRLPAADGSRRRRPPEEDASRPRCRRGRSRRRARCSRRSTPRASCISSGKIPPAEKKEDGNAANAANNFDPEEINPPVQSKGGMTALLHAARQGNLEAARALARRRRRHRSARRRRRDDSPLLMAVINGQFDMAMFLIERGANSNLAASGNGVAPLWAAINTQWQPRTRFPQPQQMEQQKATYLDVDAARCSRRARTRTPA